MLFILGAAAAVFYFSFDRIIFYVIPKIYNIEISYKKLDKDPKEGYLFEGLKILNKKMGMGFFSSRAAIKPVPGKYNIFKSICLNFKFKDSRFIKIAKDSHAAEDDTLEGLVSVPFSGKWKYSNIDGSVEIFSNGFTLKNFKANSREIDLFIEGDIFYNGAVDVNITSSFSKDVLKDIPPELPNAVMNDEPEERKSLSVKVRGNSRSPSIQVSGKLFRLNIGTMTVKDQ